MKKLTFLLSLCIGCRVVIAQSFFNSLEITAARAYQQHDDRWYDMPAPEGRDRYFTFGINTELFAYKAWTVNLGVGYTKEVINFNEPQPFNHCFFTGTPCTFVLMHMERYENELFLFPVDVRYSLQLSDQHSFNLNFQLLPAINSHKAITRNRGTEFSKSVLDFYALEFNPGIGFMFFDRVGVNLNYRAFQLKNIDEVICYYATEERFETDNPRKIWLSLRYKLFRFKQK